MSKIFDHCSKRAQDCGMKLEKLTPARRFEGTLAHFSTSISGEPLMLHYGYTSILAELDRVESGCMVSEAEIKQEMAEV
jgi:hypothetical protein